jgi:hypothetical protein
MFSKKDTYFRKGNFIEKLRLMLFQRKARYFPKNKQIDENFGKKASRVCVNLQIGQFHKQTKG